MDDYSEQGRPVPSDAEAAAAYWQMHDAMMALANSAPLVIIEGERGMKKRPSRSQIGTDANRKALERAIVRMGGIVRFAKTLGVTNQAVTQWRKRKCVPLTRAVQIEQECGIPREELVTGSYVKALRTPPSPLRQYGDEKFDDSGWDLI